MNIFMTSGTPDFMERLKEKYADERIDCHARARQFFITA